MLPILNRAIVLLTLLLSIDAFSQKDSIDITLKIGDSALFNKRILRQDVKSLGVDYGTNHLLIKNWPKRDGARTVTFYIDSSYAYLLKSSGINVESFNQGYISQSGFVKDKTYFTIYRNGNTCNIMGIYNEKKNGSFVSFYEDGSIYETGKYKEDNKVGTWITFDKKGNIIKKEYYK